MESPANIVAVQLIESMENIPVLKEILEDFRRSNPNELMYTISKVTNYLEEQKTNILRKDKTLKQVLNNSVLSEVGLANNAKELIRETLFEFGLANRIKNNNEKYNNTNKDIIVKKGKYCWFHGYGNHSGYECKKMPSTVTQAQINANDPIVDGKDEGNHHVHKGYCISTKNN